MIEERFFDTRAEMFMSLHQDCVQRLADAVDNRGRASLLVSGGSTPAPLYEMLATTELPWHSVTVALVDERWVAPDQDGSNEAFIKSHLLQALASTATYIPTKTPHHRAIDGLASCEQAYGKLSRPFDLTILGMGPDGHTASLFPRAEGLDVALDISRQQLCAALCARPSAVTGDLCERLSLSLYGLLQAQQLHIVITGEEKLSVYQAAKTATQVTDTPVSAVLQQASVPVLVYWAP